MKTLSWTTRLELALAEPRALRVLGKSSILGMAQYVAPGISAASVERWIQEAVKANRLQRVVRGLYLNRLLTPPAQACEAAVWLRPGALISLQTVLGDAGAWNNYTSWVTAVVPFSSRYTRPSLGRVDAAAGTFVFRGMPEWVLECGREEDRLVPEVAYRRATPEAALLHWLYLANSPHSHLSQPPLDLDIDAFHIGKLRRLARAMGLKNHLEAWHTQAESQRATEAFR
jgi:hypothetical protein